MESKCPPISDELIKYLESIYPDHMPSMFRGEWAMGTLYGEVSVVRHLKRVRDEQREDMLGTQLSLPFGD